MQFGISTHLYHDRRLSREHLAEIASYGFEAVEVFATRTHFDYHDPAAIEQLAGWLEDTALRLHGVHAPITDRLSPQGEWGAAISNAVTDATRREAAVREAEAALQIVKRIPAKVFVVHLGTPTVQGGENNRTAAFRSAAEIARAAEAAGVRAALEVIPNDLSDAQTLVTLIERDLEGLAAGICLDFGHAFLMGDVPDAIEAVAEHLVTTHVHDNHGRKDDHLVPFDGRIDWDRALFSLMYVGSDATFLMERSNTSTPHAVRLMVRAARQRFETLLTY
jgi:sugar phosphate isomerase/epimerase